nr:MAG TPA: tail tape measure [Caudoviricetes sp.]
MVNENLVNVKKQAEDTSAGTLSAFKTLASGLSALGFGAMIKNAISLAGDLQQNIGGSESVFKNYAGTIQKTAETAASSLGLSQSKYLATATKMGSLFQGSGFSVAQSADMVTQSMQRASDVASIMGISVDSAMEAVAGMAKGNFTMMDNLGVAINDTNLQIYAQEKGLGKLETTQQKVNAAMQMFLDKSEYAAGNYAKENDTYSGALTTFKAELEDFAAEAGTALLPLVQSVLPVLSSSLSALKPVIMTVAEAVGGLGGIVADIQAKVEAATPAQQTMLKIAIGMAVAIPAVTAATRLMRAAKLAYTGVLNILIPKQWTYASALKATMGWIGIIVGALALLGIASNKGTEGIDDSSEKLNKENEAACKAAEGVDDVAESTDNLTDSVKRSLAGFDELNRLSGNSGTLASSVVSSTDVDNAEGLADALSDVQEKTKNIDLGSLSFDIDFSNIWSELNKLLGKLKSGEIGNSIKSLFNNLGTTLKPFFDGIDEMFGFNLDKWLKDLGNFIGDIVTDISNGDIDKAIDDVFAFVKNSFINIAPSITTICSKIIGEVDKLLGTSFQKSFDKCAELCYQAGVMLSNVINDTAGKTERSQKYNTTYSEMLTYMRDWMVKNDSTSADDAYGETVSHFNVNNDEELKKWFNEGNYGASLYEFAKTTAMQIKNDEVDPVLKRRLKGQATWADISSLGILGYADGGFPDYGDLFIANEAGPELVGTIGNRTAVANSSSIETAIYNAVRSAMSDSTGGQSTDIHVTVDIDGDTVGETVARYNAVRNRRLNGRS